MDGNMDGWWLGCHEKLGPGLAGKLGSVLRLMSCILGNLITVILTPRFWSGPFFFSPRDYSPDPSSSSPEILVRTLLLLPPRCKFGLFFFYPRDASLDPSSSTPEILVRTLLLLLLLQTSFSLSSIPKQRTPLWFIPPCCQPITASISSTIINLYFHFQNLVSKCP